MLRKSVPYAATYGLRPVQRFFPDMHWRMDAGGDEKVAYLTFDDGPNATITRELIDILDRHEAHATFFLVGANAAKRPDLVRDLVAANHTVGNHTFTHPDAWTVPADELRAELDRTTTTIEQITGNRVRVMRPPYGHPTSAMRRWCDARRQRMVMWDVMPGDYLRTASERSIHDFVLRSIRPGSIIVLHDNPICESITPAALDSLLSVLRHDGWRFPAL